MPQYIMIYKGEATDMADMTPEQGMEVMAKWNAWMGKVGPSLSDVGSPFGPGTSLVDDGSTAAAESLTGYSIVEAADIDQARSHADGHPYLSEGEGNFAIDIYELMPVPFDN
ncbi:MAG: YciI family protein [Acidimicrobiia bacterium]